jgi:hypothetical protein
MAENSYDRFIEFKAVVVIETATGIAVRRFPEGKANEALSEGQFAAAANPDIKRVTVGAIIFPPEMPREAYDKLSDLKTAVIIDVDGRVDMIEFEKRRIMEAVGLGRQWIDADQRATELIVAVKLYQSEELGYHFARRRPKQKGSAGLEGGPPL